MPIFSGSYDQCTFLLLTGSPSSEVSEESFNLELLHWHEFFFTDVSHSSILCIEAQFKEAYHAIKSNIK